MREPEESNVILGSQTASEIPDAVQWGVGKESAHRLSLRNTGRIEQLEAGQEGLKKLFTAVLGAAEGGAIRERIHGERDSVVYIMGSWGSGKSSVAHYRPKSLARGWSGAVVRELAETETPYAERFSELGELYSELKEDFEEIGLRIARCALLEESLGVLEDDLEEEEGEYLSWCVSLLRDVLDYNYAEELTEDRLDALGKGIETICTERLSCDRESYRELHKRLLATGVALLPTSRKAQEKYGQKESGDGGEKLLFS